MPRRGDGSAPGAGSVAARARRGHISRPGDRVRGGTQLQAGLAPSPHPENPGGRPGSGWPCPSGAGAGCSPPPAASPGQVGPSPPGREGWGFPAPRARLAGSGAAAAAPPPCPRCRGFPLALRSRPGRRLFPLSPRPRVLGRSPWRVWGQGDTPGSRDSPPAPLPKEDSLPLLYPFPLRHKHLNAAEEHWIILSRLNRIKTRCVLTLGD